MKLDWYQKPTASGRLINYFSKHPTNIITNTANNFIRRVLQISDSSFHKDNIHKIKNILTKNDFPLKIIDKLLKKQTENKSFQSDKIEKIYKSIPYVHGLSERLKSSQIINDDKYFMTFKTTNTLQKLFTNLKSKIDKNDKSNVIYKITCLGNKTEKCNNKYIGTTKSKLKTRISQHKSDIKLLDKNKTLQKTALATHCAKHNHTPNFDTVQIIDQENNYKKRLMLETLHIVNTPTNERLNYKCDSEHLAHSFRYLIEKKSNLVKSKQPTRTVAHNKT